MFFFIHFLTEKHTMAYKIWSKIRHTLRNKYLLTVVLFTAWIIFFDSNNLVTRQRMIRDVRKLKKDCQYYENRIVSDSIKLDELKSSPEMLEKFAREEYLMKKENEDIFVIVEK